MFYITFKVLVKSFISVCLYPIKTAFDIGAYNSYISILQKLSQAFSSGF